MRSIAVTKGIWIGQLLRRHALLAGLALLYAVLAYWLSKAHDIRIGTDKTDMLVWNFLRMVPQMAFFVLFWRLLHLTYVDKVPDRFSTLKSDVRRFLSDHERLAGGALTVVIMAVVLIAFAQMKNLIPRLNPFSWDVFFMDLDRSLHFGTLPHEYTLALFGGHYAISFFTGIYNVWLFLTYFVLLIACFLRPDSAGRMQFLVAFVLTWAIGGSLLATIFSSAGPVYYAALGLGDTYAGLMDQLNAHAATGALTVIDTQALLWRIHTMDNGINAISAFPSMHVASSTLMAIFAFRLSRGMGLAVSLFGLGIMIGSVLLAWHYALDGYAGALLALAFWPLAGWLVRRFGDYPAR